MISSTENKEEKATPPSVPPQQEVQVESLLVQGQASEFRCVICLQDIDPVSVQNKDTGCYQSRCGHITHSQCLRDSIRSGNYNCPLCRQPLGEISVEPVAQKRLQRYANMLKSGLPIAAVRQRMVVDRINATIIDDFFTGGASRLLGEDGKSSASERESMVLKLFEKYRKMLDRGMPEGAVRQKMEAAQELSKEEIDRFFTTVA